MSWLQKSLTVRRYDALLNGWAMALPRKSAALDEQRLRDLEAHLPHQVCGDGPERYIVGKVEFFEGGAALVR